MERAFVTAVIIAAGGTQVIPDEAVKTGIDQGLAGFPMDRRGLPSAEECHAPER